MSKKKIYKKSQKLIQDKLRNDPPSIDVYAEAFSKHIKKVLLYVDQEASKEHKTLEDNTELSNYIDEYIEFVKEELKMILTLAAGDEIIVNRRDFKPSRFKILDLRK